jgi:hypothetical protein
MNGQLSVMKQQLNEMQAEQRPWIFFNYPNQAPIPRLNGNSFSVPIKFNLENDGNTPAIITKVTLHLFVAGDEWPPAEPDPTSSTSIPLMESYRMPLISPQSGIVISDLFSSNEIVIPAHGSLGSMEEDFSFINRTSSQLTIEAKQERPNTPVIPIGARRMWIYCLIDYKDTSGLTGQTSYYAELAGTMASMPQHDQYNYWK